MVNGVIRIKGNRSAFDGVLADPNARFFLQRLIAIVRDIPTEELGATDNETLDTEIRDPLEAILLEWPEGAPESPADEGNDDAG